MEATEFASLDATHIAEAMDEVNSEEFLSVQPTVVGEGGEEPATEDEPEESTNTKGIETPVKEVEPEESYTKENTNDATQGKFQGLRGRWTGNRTGIRTGSRVGRPRGHSSD